MGTVKHRKVVFWGLKLKMLSVGCVAAQIQSQPETTGRYTRVSWMLRVSVKDQSVVKGTCSYLPVPLESQLSAFSCSCLQLQ